LGGGGLLFGGDLFAGRLGGRGGRQGLAAGRELAGGENDGGRGGWFGFREEEIVRELPGPEDGGRRGGRREGDGDLAAFVLAQFVVVVILGVLADFRGEFDVLIVEGQIVKLIIEGTGPQDRLRHA
jgi:hypothetical protein